MRGLLLMAVIVLIVTVSTIPSVVESPLPSDINQSLADRITTEGGYEPPTH